MGEVASLKAPPADLRERFWELPLADLSRAEWEALCDGCGKCCLHKIEDADTGEIEDTNVACKLLDCTTAQCSDYRNRRAFVPDCLRLTLKIVEDGEFKAFPVAMFPAPGPTLEDGFEAIELGPLSPVDGEDEEGR